jgi:hypothetical protein
MRINARLLATGAALAILGIWFLANPGNGSAADDKDVRDDVLKVAEALEKKDAPGARKQAEAVAKKNELEDVMGLFRLRTKKGLGVGPTAGVVKPDGIEAKIMALGKQPLRGSQLDTEAPALVQSAYVAAAIAEIARDKCPVDKKQGDKDPASWRNWTNDLEKASMDLAAAAEKKDAASIKTAANKMNSTCNACHAVFRD